MFDGLTTPRYMALIISELSDKTKLKIMYHRSNACSMMFRCDSGHFYTVVAYPNSFIDLMSDIVLQFTWVKGYMFRFPNVTPLSDPEFMMLSKGNYSTRYLCSNEVDIDSMIFLLKCKNHRFDETTIQVFHVPPTHLRPI